MTTQEKIKVMQAYLDGATIICGNFSWRKDSGQEPSWNWDCNDYKIKKLEYWINIYPDTTIIHESEQKAKESADHNLIKTAHVVEKIDG